jgi:hypothetical protein
MLLKKNAIFLKINAFAQDAEIEVISQTDVPMTGVTVGATLGADENKELAKYALDKFKMKAPVAITSSTGGRSVTEFKDTKTGKMHKITTVMYDLKPVDPKDKSSASILNVTNENGDKYSSLVYTPQGDVNKMQEITASKIAKTGKIQVGGVSNFWRCLKSKLLATATDCAKDGVQSLYSCGPISWGWVICVTSKYGWCFTKAKANCLCQTWCGPEWWRCTCRY